MASSKLSRYGMQQALEAIMRKTQSPAIGNVFLALCTNADPPDEADATMAAVAEYAATGYARQIIAFGSATLASPSVIANSGTITFGPFTAGTGAVISHACIVDHVSNSSANIIASVALTASRTPATGDSLQGAASSFTFSIN